MIRLGVLTGMRGEARFLRRAADHHASLITIGMSGADPERARAEARRLADKHPTLLVSFGFAGGLDPALPPGALVCPGRYHLDDGTVQPLDPLWRRRLVAALPQAHDGTIAAVNAAVTTCAGKRALAEQGCHIADMETAALAEVATERGLPLIVLRAVCDPAHRPVPAAALALLAPGGGLRWKVLPGVLPDLPAMARLGMDSARAGRRLGTAADALCRAVNLAEDAPQSA